MFKSIVGTELEFSGTGCGPDDGWTEFVVSALKHRIHLTKVHSEEIRVWGYAEDMMNFLDDYCGGDTDRARHLMGFVTFLATDTGSGLYFVGDEERWGPYFPWAVSDPD